MSLNYIGSLTVADVFPQVYDLLQKLTTFINAYASVQAAIPSLSALLDVLATIEGGLDFLVDAPFGLGALKLSAVLEFQGALKAVAGLTVAIANPLAQAVSAISAMAAATASLTASLSLGLPTVSAELSVQLTAMTAVVAAASAKMLGIQVVIDAAMSLLGPLANARMLVEALLTLFLDMNAAFQAVASLAAEFITHMPNPGVHLFAGDALYEESFDAGGHATGKGMLDLGFPPAGLTFGLPIKTALLVVNNATSPDTWVSVQFMIRTS
jgi:hypothetical protein